MPSLHKKRTYLTVVFSFLIALVLGAGAYLFLKSLPESNAPQYRKDVQATSTTNYDFFIASANRLNEITKQFQARNDLMQQLPTKEWTAPVGKKDYPSFNDYLSIRDISLDQVDNTLQWSFDTNEKALAQADTSCPSSDPKGLTSSGALLLSSSGSKLLSYTYQVRDVDSNNLVYTGKKSTAYSTSTDLQATSTFADSAYLDQLPQGTYRLSIIPGCESVYPNQYHSLAQFTVAATVDKLITNTSSIRRASINDTLLKITQPPISPVQNGEAVINLPYQDNPDGPKTIYLPYIQTSPDLNITAVVDLNTYFKEKYKDIVLPKIGTKEHTETDVFSVSFSLYSPQGKEIRRESTPFFTDSPLNENFNVPFLKTVSTTIKGLPKGEYELVTRLERIYSKEGSIKKEILWQSKLSSIGIGDIAIVLGEEYRGYVPEEAITGDIVDTRDIRKINNASIDSTGRNIPWPKKDCEFDASTCSQVAWYTEFTKDLGDILSTQLDHPVMLVPELLPERGQNMGDLMDYLSHGIAKQRMDILSPNYLFIEHQGTGEISQLSTGEKDLGALEQDLNTVVANIQKQFPQVTTFIATPFASKEAEADSYSGLIRAYTTDKDTSVLPGANLYPISKDLSSQELMTNIANAWKEALLPYLSTKEVTPTKAG